MLLIMRGLCNQLVLLRGSASRRRLWHSGDHGENTREFFFLFVMSNSSSSDDLSSRALSDRSQRQLPIGGRLRVGLRQRVATGEAIMRSRTFPCCCTSLFARSRLGVVVCVCPCVCPYGSDFNSVRYRCWYSLRRIKKQGVSIQLVGSRRIDQSPLPSINTHPGLTSRARRIYKLEHV